MSFAVTKLVYEQSLEKAGNRAVLLAIAFHADDEGEAWPGIPLLAQETALCERHVRRCLRHLQKKNILEIMPGLAPGGGWLFRVRLDQFRGAKRHITSITKATTTASGNRDAGVTTHYIRELSEETSVRTDSQSSFGSLSAVSLPEPSLDDVRSYAASNEIPLSVAETWWYESHGRGWIDSKGIPIRKWQSALTAYSRKWIANAHSPRRWRNSPGTNGGSLGDAKGLPAPKFDKKNGF